MAFLKQNWRTFDTGILGILIVGAIFIVRGWKNSSPSISLISDIASKTPLQSHDPTSYQMVRAVSTKSHDGRLTVTVDNKKVDEISILTVRTDMGKVKYHRSDILPMFDTVFSTDDKKIYYRKPYATTSTAIYEFDLETGNERYITDGNSLTVISEGEYRGNLIIEKHKYYGPPNYGSYDHHYIVTDSGKELKDLGEY